MALTNFANLTQEEKTIWSMDFWKMARNNSFISRFAGKGANSMVQRVTELKKSEKGARAVISLVADLEGDGVMGDSTLEGNEEEIKSYDQVINIDQIRNANRLEGRVADQKSIVNFRSASRDVLAYWAADRIDQLAFLTLSGMEYDTRTNSAARPTLATGRNLSDLEFNPTSGSPVGERPPTDDRHFRWDGKTTQSWLPGDTTAISAEDTITYPSLVWAKAMAKDRFIRGIKTGGGEEIFHVFLTPTAMATLRLDSDYISNVRNAAPRSKNNELFAGTSSVMVDGMVIHEYRHVINTKGLTSTNKWGSGGTVDGCRALFCGAQALGMADIGNAYWEEDEFDYANQPGISVGKMLGFLKPKFYTQYSPAPLADTQDFGVMCLDYATP
jgi:N4-gp56 family major capsid protein